jgi:hypothetical protein
MCGIQRIIYLALICVEQNYGIQRESDYTLVFTRLSVRASGSVRVEHFATRRKVAGSRPDETNVFFSYLPNHSGRTRHKKKFSDSSNDVVSV